jgi:FMN phosphatase YigB (HAD superfamily)
LRHFGLKRRRLSARRLWLAVRLGVAEYDFLHLATALVEYYKGPKDVEAAVETVLSTRPAATDETIDLAAAALSRGLEEIPPLLDGVEAALTQIRTHSYGSEDLAQVLLSEGRPERLKKILHAHESVLSSMDAVLILTKTPDAFLEAQRLGAAQLGVNVTAVSTTVAVGDSLQRDITFAKNVKFTTVYKPSEYKGTEAPRNSADSPDFIIQSIAELPGILRRIGVLRGQP